MAFEQLPNSGNMFINQKKTTPLQPDFRGSIHIDKTLLENLINKSKGNLVEVALSGWNKTSAKGNDYISLAASEPYIRPQEKQPWEQ